MYIYIYIYTPIDARSTAKGLIYIFIYTYMYTMRHSALMLLCFFSVLAFFRGHLDVNHLDKHARSWLEP